MRGWIVVLIILGVWIAYKRDKTFASAVNRVLPANKTAGTLTSPLAAGYGNSSAGASRSGSSSPGSGRATVQPPLYSTWGVGSSGAGAGFTGVRPYGGPKKGIGAAA